MVIAIFWGFFFGSLSTEQVHFNACLKDEFKSPVCKTEQKLCKLGEDKERCK